MICCCPVWILCPSAHVALQKGESLETDSQRSSQETDGSCECRGSWIGSCSVGWNGCKMTVNGAAQGGMMRKGRGKRQRSEEGREEDIHRPREEREPVQPCWRSSRADQWDSERRRKSERSSSILWCTARTTATLAYFTLVRADSGCLIRSLTMHRARRNYPAHSRGERDEGHSPLAAHERLHHLSRPRAAAQRYPTMASPRLLSTLSHAIPSTSSFSLATPSSSVLRLFSSSPSRSAVSTANRPKRDATAYGLPRRMNRKDWPKKDETNTDAHPLWRFFHNKESLEVPDKRNDYSSAFTCSSAFPLHQYPCYSTVPTAVPRLGVCPER